MYIYCIKNIINNKVYIGKCKNIKNRFSNHLNNLRNNRHHSIKLQRAWNKYGEENFKFSLILDDIGKENVCNIEKDYILKFNSYHEGYNCTLGGEIGDLGLKNWKGKFGENHNVAKKVYQYSLDGNFIKKWGSIIDAARSLGLNRSNLISKCANEKCKTAYGFLWKDKYYGNKINKSEKRLYKGRPIIMLCFKTNEEIERFKSSREAEIFLNKTKNKIHAVCKGSRNTWAGYKWKYQ